MTSSTTPSLTIGLNNTATSSTDNVYYLQSLSVSVVDQTGKPLANQLVNVKVVPTQFYKGFEYFNTTNKSWYQGSISQANATTTGYVSPASSTFVMNYLQTGLAILSSPICTVTSSLTPNNPVSLIGSTTTAQIASYTTDNTGKFDFSIRYAKAYANWLGVTLTATTTVTQNPNTATNTSSSSISFDLHSLVSDYDATGATLPPNEISPYGIIDECNDFK